MKSHTVVFIVDERYSISHISHKQIKMSFDAIRKTVSKPERKAIFLLKKIGVLLN